MVGWMWVVWAHVVWIDLGLEQLTSVAPLVLC